MLGLIGLNDGSQWGNPKLSAKADHRFGGAKQKKRIRAQYDGGVNREAIK